LEPLSGDNRARVLLATGRPTAKTASEFRVSLSFYRLTKKREVRNTRRADECKSRDWSDRQLSRQVV